MAASPAKRIRTPAFTPFSPVANDARIDNTLERMRDERESDGTLGVWGNLLAIRSLAPRAGAPQPPPNLKTWSHFAQAMPASAAPGAAPARAFGGMRAGLDFQLPEPTRVTRGYARG